MGTSQLSTCPLSETVQGVAAWERIRESKNQSLICPAARRPPALGVVSQVSQAPEPDGLDPEALDPEAGWASFQLCT